VPFEGQAIGAKGVFAGVGAAVGQELAEVAAAHRTGYFVAPVKDGHGAHGHVADALQVAARYVPDDETDEVLHALLRMGKKPGAGSPGQIANIPRSTGFRAKIRIWLHYRIGNKTAPFSLQTHKISPKYLPRLVAEFVFCEIYLVAIRYFFKSTSFRTRFNNEPIAHNGFIPVIPDRFCFLH
jgi:hypothetical protein